MKLSRLFIIFYLSLAVSGFAILTLASFLEQQRAQNIQEAKERALKGGLKDEQGNPMISSDALRQHLLADEKNYQIIYQEKGDFFIISINDSPFNEIREKAESHFLSLTQAAPNIACQLDVRVVTPRWVDPKLSGQTFSLSFCQK